MSNATLKKELDIQWENLPSVQQRQVVEFARALNQSRPRGIPGKDLLRFAGTLSDQEAKEMMEAIEEGCGKIDYEGW